MEESKEMTCSTMQASSGRCSHAIKLALILVHFTKWCEGKIQYFSVILIALRFKIPLELL